MEKFEYKKHELLAPAGSYETMVAAFNAGADAVYVGGASFGARANANNFNKDELISAINYAHLFDKRLYLTVNTLLKDNEIDNSLYDFLLPYYEGGLDAVIVQDLGVMEFIKLHFPKLSIHCSTQMTITGSHYAKKLKELGATRIVTPRELSFNEINDIYKATGLEIESFVHGALCYCYSGQCLLSSIIGGRSGNRGRCAQPCRLPYSISELDIKNKYILSPKDLCTLDLLPDILKSGVYSLKIEGRMKKPEYVASVVSIYKKYLNLYERGTSEYKVDRNDVNILKEIYNRGGFTDGFFNKHNGKEMMTIERPNHVGVQVAKVVKHEGNSLTINVTQKINKGDQLEIGNNKFEFFTPGEYDKGNTFIYKSKDIKGNVNGCIINRTRNNILINELLNTYLYQTKEELKHPYRHVKINVTFKKNEKVLATAYDELIRVSVRGNTPGIAQNKPIEKEDIIKQFTKSGGTNFVIDEVNIDYEAGLFFPLKEFNELRRQLLKDFEATIYQSFSRTITDNDNESEGSSKHIYDDKVNVSLLDNASIAKVSVLVSNKEQVEACLNTQILDIIEKIYLEYTNFSMPEIANIINLTHNNGIKLYLALPYVFRKNVELDLFTNKEEFIKLNYDGILHRSLESFFFMKNNDFEQREVAFDSNVYAFNNYDISFYKKLGANIITASYENNYTELCNLDTQFMEMNIYGYIPVMYSAGCIMKNLNECQLKINAKTMNTNKIIFTDRLQNNFTAINICRYCYNVIYNSLPMSLIGTKDEVDSIGFKAYRINLTIESFDESINVLTQYKNACLNLRTEHFKDFTRGHFKRGVE